MAANAHLFEMIDTDNEVDMDAFRKAMETYFPHIMGGHTEDDTLLMRACQNGHADVVRELVELYPEREHIFARDNDGRTALMFASGYVHPKCVTALLDAVTDPDLRREMICMRSSFGYDSKTALMCLVMHDRPECVKALCFAIEDPDDRRDMIRMRDTSPRSQTALMYAVSHGRADVVEVLLEMCPSAIEDTWAKDPAKNAEALIRHGDERTRTVFAMFWEKKRNRTKGISLTST